MKVTLTVDIVNGSQGKLHKLIYTNGCHGSLTIEGDKYKVAEVFDAILANIKKEYEVIMSIGVD